MNRDRAYLIKEVEARNERRDARIESVFTEGNRAVPLDRSDADRHRRIDRKRIGFAEIVPQRPAGTGSGSRGVMDLNDSRSRNGNLGIEPVVVVAGLSAEAVVPVPVRNHPPRDPRVYNVADPVPQRRTAAGVRETSVMDLDDGGSGHSYRGIKSGVVSMARAPLDVCLSVNLPQPIPQGTGRSSGIMDLYNVRAG